MTKCIARLLAGAAFLGVASVAAQAGDPAAGEARYGETCANCHGKSGRGMANFPSLKGRDADDIEWNTLFTTWRRGANDPSANGAHAINVSFAAMDPFFAMVRFTATVTFPPVSNN